MPYAQGCRDCGKRTPNDRCRVCLAAHRKREAKRRAVRKLAGLCLVCGDPVARSKRIVGGKLLVKKPAAYCQTHLDYFAARAS
jgi:hypothetical protein